MRHLKDRLSYPRGTRLVMGNALVGRLLFSLSQRDNASMLSNTSVEQIHSDASGVYAVTLAQGTERRTVQVKGGVILASGGFNRNPRLRKTMLPGVDPAWCPGAPGHTGEAHELALDMGAHYIAALQATLDTYNQAARAGKDPAFRRGGTPYERVQGDLFNVNYFYRITTIIFPVFRTDL